ncbi:uncharacterized protein LOC125680811 isoform X2 [Ostrea edulis]|uniref:uncharacterized protein LOC125680811 isoform X2 n=1 Tax=Ostrea edulis TaxID=37623 RepID=UPI0024AFA099|nr:uncharacterized protein LOC125680811 isoform X2 [Ostrea edulis]
MDVTRIVTVMVIAFACTCGLDAATRPIPFSNSIRVRLWVYSGSSDPSWRISQSSRFYRNISYMMSIPTQQPPTTLSRLGYNGFDVKMPGRRVTKIYAKSNPPLETLLLLTGRRYIEKDIFNYVLADIHGQNRG